MRVNSIPFGVVDPGMMANEAVNARRAIKELRDRHREDVEAADRELDGEVFYRRLVGESPDRDRDALRIIAGLAVKYLGDRDIKDRQVQDDCLVKAGQEYGGDGKVSGPPPVLRPPTPEEMAAAWRDQQVKMAAGRTFVDCLKDASRFRIVDPNNPTPAELQNIDTYLGRLTRTWKAVRKAYKFHKRGRKVRATDDHVRTRLAQKAPVTEIARELKVSRTTVHKVKKRLEVEAIYKAIKDAYPSTTDDVAREYAAKAAKYLNGRDPSGPGVLDDCLVKAEEEEAKS